MQSAEDLPLTREGLRDICFLSGRSLFGQSEIEQLNSLFGEQNVRRLQVAMGDALAMGGIESFENLAGVFDGLVDRHRAVQRRTLDEFHHQIIGTDIVNLAYVR